MKRKSLRSIKKRLTSVLKKKKASLRKRVKLLNVRNLASKLGRKKTISKKSAQVDTRKSPPKDLPQQESFPKFSTPAREFRTVLRDLPASYGKERLVLMVRDPWWIFCYWELAPSKLEEAKRKLNLEDLSNVEFVLRVYDISNIIFNGRNAHSYFDIPVDIGARNWYINLPGDGRSWCVDLGLKGEFGFFTILRSNPVHCPSAHPSWITDEEWYSPWEDFLKMYAASVGERSSSPLGKEIFEKRYQEIFPSGMFSGQLASGVLQRKQKRQFFLEVWTELILYGRTEPAAKVKVQGKEIPLRKDGTFSLRFFLPDGTQTIPVEAQSPDRLETRKITPLITRKTL